MNIRLMEMNTDDSRSEKTREKAAMPSGTPVLVQCAGFRCLAYQDGSGKWRSIYSHEPLPGTIEIIPEP